MLRMNLENTFWSLYIIEKPMPKPIRRLEYPIIILIIEVETVESIDIYSPILGNVPRSSVNSPHDTTADTAAIGLSRNSVCLSKSFTKILGENTTNAEAKVDNIM
ncbi:unnamed protein product [Meganyctiphanes norvegica]|uniref:Uncharacterized protein n=1 Tax=Meganyctiphanes norvegica TaxID=48144 RepID=A0AAV2RP59_MEGNR